MTKNDYVLLEQAYKQVLGQKEPISITIGMEEQLVSGATIRTLAEDANIWVPTNAPSELSFKYVPDGSITLDEDVLGTALKGIDPEFANFLRSLPSNADVEESVVEKHHQTSGRAQSERHAPIQARDAARYGRNV
jgi:hypothetical protein